MRRVTWIILLIVVGCAVAIAAGRALGLFSGERPDSIGVSAGRIAPCKPSPNCVSSQADRSDAVHYIAPVSSRGDTGLMFEALKRIVRETERANIVIDGPDYLYAEYRSRVIGFVDDVEFRLYPHENVVHVRSASRVGRSDFGVNRARIERIRARLNASKP